MIDIKKTKVTPEQKLAALLAKQKLLADKAAILKRAINEQAEAKANEQKLKFGRLAEEAGILNLSDSILKKALAEIAKANGISSSAAPATPAVKPPVTAPEVKAATPAPAPSPAPTVAEPAPAKTSGFFR
ncbi:hypothetical protein D521_0456 [beta proteobacterium CB]|nr:hypothetical protein D521_0456 [beta proteobacterium CB]